MQLGIIMIKKIAPLGILSIAIGMSIYVYSPLPNVNFSNNDLSIIPILKNTSPLLSDAITSPEYSKIKTYRAASIDGGLRLDKNNHLIIDRDVRHWIDFHLAALGELSIEQIKAMMVEYILKLPNPGQDEALLIVEKYLSYKNELAGFDEQFAAMNAESDLDAMQQRYEWQKRLRRESLEPEVVEAFWSMDEKIDDVALNKLLIRNSDLSNDEKEEAQRALERDMPIEWQELRESMQKPSKLSQQVERLKAEGAGAEEVYEYRKSSVGIEAADRLQSLDAERQVWHQKLINYNQEKQRVESIEGLSNQERSVILEDYVQAHFTTKEQLRVSAASQLIQ